MFVLFGTAAQRAGRHAVRLPPCRRGARYIAPPGPDSTMNVAPDYPCSPDGDGAAVGLGGGVLDSQALVKLQELDPGGKGGLVQRVLATYMSSLSRLLEQFGAARKREDEHDLHHVAHALKSASASVGALQLSSLCADIERRLRDSQTDGLEPLLEAMAREGERILAALRATSKL
jgi:hypothetical protein